MMADKKKKQQEAVETANGTFGELKAMVTDYAKQQTTEPLKNLGSWTVFGLVGAVMFIIGAFLMGLGVLRGLQSISWFQPSGSSPTTELATAWPYLGTAFVLLLAAGACGFAATKTPDWMD